MRFDVFSLFPEVFDGYLSHSILARAIERKLIDVQLHNFRDWAKDKHQQVDDRPYGGGPGMVLKPEPVVAAVEEVQASTRPTGRVLLLSPQGRVIDQPWLEARAGESRLLILCGRYEGFDERITTVLQPEIVSLGKFVLGGGEIPALAIIDGIARLLPGVLGDDESSSLDSFSAEDRGLEHAQYTRPRVFRGLEVPEVLVSGDHGRVAAWRQQSGAKRTAAGETATPTPLQNSFANQQNQPTQEKSGDNA